ncbi:MAG: ThuA domain-containing protein [Planctomycetota bacterium]
MEKAQIGLMGFLVITCASALAAETPVAVSKEEQTKWLRWLIPLPKQIAIEKKITMPSCEVQIVLREGAGEVEQCAAEEIRSLFMDRANERCDRGRFEIVVGVCDEKGNVGKVAVPDTAQLAKLPNADQAYLIAPHGDDRLVLTALNEKGVFYASQTLRQLLEPTFTYDHVTIPLAKVMDWPDLEERGEWGGNSTQDILWMTRHKMNVVEAHVQLSMTADGRGEARADEEKIAFARRRAFNYVPIITHLNGIGRTGIYNAYPDLMGQGERARHRTYPDLVAPCCSHPKLTEVFADWMCSLASQKGVTHICAWLSELENQFCSCEKCKASELGQYAMETRCLVEAWRLARKKFPNLQLRILLTQGSYDTNDKVLAQVPKEVGITYYDGGRTYDSSRDPMIYPLLEKYVAEGGWLGCYPQLTASWRIVCPWSGPQFIKYRMNEFVDKKLKCLCGYATPHNRLYDFNVVASAEWSWNAKGRTEQEFAAAWATRRGMKDPDAVADWAVMIGPVGWDVYGSRVPFYFVSRRPQHMVKQRTKPALGEGIFRYFPTVEHMEQDLATCEKAMAIAKRLNEPLLIFETEAIQGYVEMIKHIFTIANRISESKTLTYPERVEMQNAMKRLSLAGMNVSKALTEWEGVVGQNLSGSRLVDTVQETERTVVDIGDCLVPLGIRSPLSAYLPHEIGAWTDTDFDQQAKITKRIDVTRYMETPGEYQVGFTYTTGWHGLGISRVALASAPKDDPEKVTELSVDEHSGSAAARNRDNIYAVTLKEMDPNCCYFILADIRGTSSVGKPVSRQGCNGTISMKAVLPADWQTRIEQAQPLTDEEMFQRDRPKFQGKGLRTGVLTGGYGSTTILAQLRKAAGIDAQPIGLIHPETMKDCQVIVLPQPRVATTLTKEAVAALEAFVRNGGGLIVTHNAVGYRDHPLLLTEVCAKGLEHVKDPTWVVVAEHPVTKGIAPNSPQPHAYMDHVEVECGPKGTVLAQASQSKRPVVVCGEVGKGRYVACGLAIGLKTDNQDAPPADAEKTLLLNVVQWCGRQ